MLGTLAELYRSLALRAPRFWKCMLVTYLGGLGLCGMTLSSGNTSCVLEAGLHDPKLMLHLGHLCTGGTGRMRTPQSSIETFWVYALRVVLGMCLVDHPWCMQVRRSRLCAERSAIATWIPGLRHRLRQSISCISPGRGLVRASPSEFLQVMLDRLLSSSFYALPWVFPRDTLSLLVQ